MRAQEREKLAQSLLDESRIKKCRARGSKQAQWLDVQDGPFARGPEEAQRLAHYAQIARDKMQGV